MKHIVILMYFLACFCIFSCKTVDSSHKKEIPMQMVEDTAYRVLEENYYSHFSHASKGVYVARSLAEAIIISEGNENVVSLCEKIDFSQEAVLFAFGGAPKIKAGKSVPS